MHLYLRGQHESNTTSFNGDAYTLALLCVIELDPGEQAAVRDDRGDVAPELRGRPG